MKSTNIDSVSTLKRLFKALDARLTEALEIYVIGAANMLASGIAGRFTEDIDVIVPSEFSPSVEQAIEEVARSQHLLTAWLNSKPFAVEYFLDNDWRTRATLFFKGKSLVVYLVGRQEMIGLKLVASMERITPDERDLLALSPSSSEWKIARKWAHKYHPEENLYGDWPKAVDRKIQELKGKQKK